ncbi:MAG: hypothetical protein ACRDRG_07930 [Pseudonocardiaceae bacterium]
MGAALALGMGAAAIASAPAAAAEPTGLRADATSVPSKDAVPGIAPPDAHKTAVYLDSAGRVIPTAKSPGAVSETALIGCTPVSGRDNPHRSSTGVAVSGHGWWNKGNCSNNRANVYNCLYEWYTDNSWRQKACSPTKELAPGGGSSSRTVARRDCHDTLLTSWRNHVDVDVIGEIDTGEWPYNQANVSCRVY